MNITSSAGDVAVGATDDDTGQKAAFRPGGRVRTSTELNKL